MTSIPNAPITARWTRVQYAFSLLFGRTDTAVAHKIADEAASYENALRVARAELTHTRHTVFGSERLAQALGMKAQISNQIENAELYERTAQDIQRFRVNLF